MDSKTKAGTMQNEEPKVYMSDEQFAWLKALEISRSKEMLARVDEQTAILKAQEARKGEELRDMFAGQAIASIPLRAWDHLAGDDTDKINAWAQCAYLVADAMIAARSAAPSPTPSSPDYHGEVPALKSAMGKGV